MAIAAKRKLTYADFVKIPADGNRHEIIEGEWVMTPAPGLDHQTAVLNIGRLLADHVERRNLGRVFVSPVDVLLSRHSILEPDVVYVSKGRAAILRGRKNIRGAPDLAVEVSSPSTAAEDRDRKLKAYRGARVREYWIVDLFGRFVEIHEFGRPARKRVYQEGQSFESRLLPGLRIEVDALFAGVR
jgi:Uma2 family endonuclease